MTTKQKIKDLEQKVQNKQLSIEKSKRSIYKLQSKIVKLKYPIVYDFVNKMYKLKNVHSMYEYLKNIDVPGILSQELDDDLFYPECFNIDFNVDGQNTKLNRIKENLQQVKDYCEVDFLDEDITTNDRIINNIEAIEYFFITLIEKVIMRNHCENEWASSSMSCEAYSDASNYWRD